MKAKRRKKIDLEKVDEAEKNPDKARKSVNDPDLPWDDAMDIVAKELGLNKAEFVTLIFAREQFKDVAYALGIYKTISKTLTFNPMSSKGKISLHYGELYLLALGIDQPDAVLCDDESVIYLNSLLTGICGTNLNIIRTLALSEFKTDYNGLEDLTPKKED